MHAIKSMINPALKTAARSYSNGPSEKKSYPIAKALTLFVTGVAVAKTLETPPERKLYNQQVTKDSQDLTSRIQKEHTATVLGFFATPLDPALLPSSGAFPYSESPLQAAAFLYGQQGFLVPVCKKNDRSIVTEFDSSYVLASDNTKLENGHTIPNSENLKPDLRKDSLHATANVSPGSAAELERTKSFSLVWDPPSLSPFRQKIQEVKDGVVREMTPHNSVVIKKLCELLIKP